MRKLLMTSALVLAATAAEAATECEVTKAQYDQIQTGMSIENAEAILGCPGEEMSSSEMAGIQTVMLTWNGNTMGANMNAMFQNGQMVMKAQFGLR